MRISDFARVCIYVSPELRDRIYRCAANSKHSLMTEVNIALLGTYKPNGWAQLEQEIKKLSRLTNPAKPTRFDNKYVSIGLHVPAGLQKKITIAAEVNFRSWSAEAAHTLAREYL